MTARASDEEVADRAERFLADHPHAYVSALDPNGFFLTMPASVPLSGQRVIEEVATALELVGPDDIAPMVRSWREQKENGVSSSPAHLLVDPGRQIVLHFFDVTARHGVRLLVLTGADDVQLTSQPESVFRTRVFDQRSDPAGVLLSVSPDAASVTGWSPEELLGKGDLDFVHPDDVPLVVADWMSMLARPGSKRRSVMRYRHKVGHYVYLEATNHNLMHSPEHGYVHMERVDISAQMAAQEALRASEQLLRTLAEALPLGVVQIDSDRRVVYRNEALAAILGRPEAVDVDGLVVDVLALDRDRVVAAIDAVLAQGLASSFEVGVFRNGSRRQIELKLRPLTGCHNRASILTILQQALVEADHGSGTAVVFLDLDHFKQVNDVHGHGAGDDVLRGVAGHLMRRARADDVVGRVGGDEFVIVCRNVRDADVAERIRERLVGSLPVSVLASGSVGVSWVPAGIQDAEGLIAGADTCMYAAKRLRRAS